MMYMYIYMYLYIMYMFVYVSRVPLQRPLSQMIGLHGGSSYREPIIEAD